MMQVLILFSKFVHI